ncbi:MAG: hypothetical protein JXA87_11015 [Thermoleophilia bacterium]|nr:hypothetical protein [Thermoleophilia bacterium]
MNTPLRIAISGARRLWGRSCLAAYRLKNRVRRLLEGRAPWEEGEVLFGEGVPGSAAQWAFHDEDWGHVRSRWENRGRLREGLRVAADGPGQKPTGEVALVGDGGVRVRGTTTTADEWVYLHLPPDLLASGDYSWRFGLRALTDFHELQFGFRYRDFYNRYRYRFEDGYVHLDHVVNGAFRNSFSSARLPLTLGRWYEVCIAVKGSRSRCYVDGCLVLDDYDPGDLFPRGSVALILWENDGVTDIEADIRDLRILRVGDGPTAGRR